MLPIIAKNNEKVKNGEARKITNSEPQKSLQKHAIEENSS